jgi:tetratricopeptide (TPR) repeat protein
MQYVGGKREELLFVGDDRYMRRQRTAPITFTEEDGAVVFHFVLQNGEYQSHPRLDKRTVLPRELLKKGDHEAALAAYRAIRAADEEDVAAAEGYLNGNGLQMLEDGEVELAIAMLRIATELYPDSANTWDSLGYAYREKGDREAALRYYQLALERDEKFASAVEAVAELKREGD